MFHSNYNVNITVKITVIFQVQFCFVILAQTSRPNKSNYFKKHNMLCIYTRVVPGWDPDKKNPEFC